WAVANNLANAAQPTPDTLVRRVGQAPPGSWNWVNLSSSSNPFAPVRLEVPRAGATLVFELATREDGLDIDKLAFGPARITHTARELDEGRPGRYVPPPPPPPPFTPSGPPLAHGHDKFL